jgi:hypothetical protein
MSNLLLWLALPLLIVPWLARGGRIGAATGQLVMAGLGLAALHQGAGTLDPHDLRTIADQSPHDAWFVAITAGVMISGACLLPDLRNWRKVVVALPLLVALLVVAIPHLAALALGLIVGAIPTALGRAAAGAPASRGMSPTAPEAAPGDAISIAVALATVVASLWGPAALAMLGLGALAWRGWSRHRAPRVPVLEVAGTVLLIGWTWFALTIAGSPFPSLRSVGMDAPISPAAAPGLALLAIGWGLAFAAPWPLDRLARVTVQLPVAAVVLHLAGMHVTPEGISHWQPALSSALVAATLAAVALNRWDGVAAAMMLLGATRGGVAPFVGAAMLALAPAIRRLRLSAPLRGSMAGVATGLVLFGLLRDEVLLSVIVAFGLATLANRADRVVARISGPVHL